VNADIRNVPSPTDSLASLAERIDGSLELIDREALKIVSGEVVLDPDATIGSIDLGSRVLRDVLSELMTVTSADQQRKPPELDLGRALREEAERLGRSHAAPLVLDLRVPAGLPAVATPEAALREIMRDLLSLCAAAAGRGGTLTIAARCEATRSDSCSRPAAARTRATCGPCPRGPGHDALGEAAHRALRRRHVPRVPRAAEQPPPARSLPREAARPARLRRERFPWRRLLEWETGVGPLSQGGK
jgi:hypothetical protein